LKTFTLYGTPACHLCDLALAMINEVGLDAGEVQIDSVDISESESLFERYGVRIPVLRHPDLRELDWPFTPVQLRAFLRS